VFEPSVTHRLPLRPWRVLEGSAVALRTQASRRARYAPTPLWGARYKAAMDAMVIRLMNFEAFNGPWWQPG